MLLVGRCWQQQRQVLAAAALFQTVPYVGTEVLQLIRPPVVASGSQHILAPATVPAAAAAASAT